MPFDATPVTSPVIQLLEKVHTRLSKGWTQGVSYDSGTNSYCLIGAIYNQTEGSKLNQQAVEALGFEWEEDVVFWNDADTRTKQGVLRKVTAAIKRERRRLLLGAK